MFAQRTEAEISTSGKFDTSSTEMTWIIFANRFLACPAEISCGAFASPSIFVVVSTLTLYVRLLIYIIVDVVQLLHHLLLARTTIPAGIRKTCQ